MTAWINVNWEMPKMHKEVWEADGERYEVEISDPVLVVEDGEVRIAMYEEDDDGFKGWVERDGRICEGIIYWTKLPNPPGGKTEPDKTRLELINLRNRLRAQREEIKRLQEINTDLRKENEWLRTRAAV